MPRIVTLPLDEAGARALSAGDEVLVRGRVLTGREAAHRWLSRHDDPALRLLAKGALLYHCEPVAARDGASGGWQVVAAAPASSARLEPYQAEVVERYGLRAVMGRGGMGPRTLAALRRHGAVYLHTASRLAVALARCVKRVEGVHLLPELGPADALWSLEVEDFPAIVTMDAHGESLHRLEVARAADAPETARAATAPAE
jgi:fumarate hydratase class I